MSRINTSLSHLLLLSVLRLSSSMHDEQACAGLDKLTCEAIQSRTDEVQGLEFLQLKSQEVAADDKAGVSRLSVQAQNVDAPAVIDSQSSVVSIPNKIHFIYCGNTSTTMREGLQDFNTSAMMRQGLQDFNTSAIMRQGLQDFSKIASNGNDELVRTIRNMVRTRDLHEGAELVFSDDLECADAVRAAHSEELANHFIAEKRGQMRSNLCRLAVLYNHGGYYMDNDLETLVDLRSLSFWKNASFIGGLEYQWHDTVYFQNSLMISMPRHPLLRSCLNFYFDTYQRLKSDQKIDFGVHIMGACVQKYLDAREFHAGYWQDKKLSLLSPGDEPDKYGGLYFFKEMTLDHSFNKNASSTAQVYGLSVRGGIGCCCNFFIGDEPNKVAIAWMRFVGSGSSCLAKHSC